MLEANSMGLPAVTFVVPGRHDAVLDGRTGRLLPEDVGLADGVDLLLRDLADPVCRGRAPGPSAPRLG